MVGYLLLYVVSSREKITRKHPCSRVKPNPRQVNEKVNPSWNTTNIIV